MVDTADGIGAVKQHVDRLDQQPPLPHAAWKRLVQDVQVTAAAARERGTASRRHHQPSTSWHFLEGWGRAFPPRYRKGTFSHSQAAAAFWYLSKGVGAAAVCPCGHTVACEHRSRRLILPGVSLRRGRALKNIPAGPVLPAVLLRTGNSQTCSTVCPSPAAARCTSVRPTPRV